MEITVKNSQLAALLDRVIAHNIDVGNTTNAIEDYIAINLVSSPGQGKTAMVKAAAARAGVPCKTVVLFDRDLPEVSGIYMPDAETKTTVRFKPEDMPTAPNGVYFIDEMTQAAMSLQCAASRQVYDRQIGEHHIPAGTTIIMAGNRTSDKAGATAMPTHLKNRVIHLFLQADVDAWQEWAAANGIHGAIRTCIKFRPGLLSDFQKDQYAFCTPRSWNTANNVLKLGLEPDLEHVMLSGAIGQGAAAELIGVVKMWRKLVPAEAILADPEGVALPDREDRAYPSIMYATMVALGQRVAKKQMGELFAYLNRVPVEFAAVCVRDIGIRFDRKIEHAAYIDWAIKNKSVVLA